MIGQLSTQFVHQNFGVRFANQMIVRFVQQFVGQFAIVGQLTVESEREPLAAVKVVIFKRLSVAAIVFAAGGVADVADRCRTRVLFHQRIGFGGVREPKHFLDRAQLAVGVQQLAVAGLGGEAGNASRKLAAILHVQQHPRDQRGSLIAIVGRKQVTDRSGQVIDRGNTAFMVEFGHRFSSRGNRLRRLAGNNLPAKV